MKRLCKLKEHWLRYRHGIGDSPASRARIGAGLTIVLGHVTTALIGLATLRLLTELAPKHVFGSASLIMTLLGLMQHIAVAPFSATMLRFHTGAKSLQEANGFANQALAWSLATSTFIALAIAIGLNFWPNTGASLTSLGIVACVVWKIATAVKTIPIARMQAEQRRFRFTFLSVLEAFLLGVVTAAALTIQPSSEAYLVGQAAAALLVAVAVVAAAPWPVLRGLDWPRRQTVFVDNVRAYGTAFVPLAVVGFLANLGDRYILAGLIDYAAVGQYVAAFAIANRGMALINSSLSDLFRPQLFDAANRSDTAGAQHVFRIWAFASLFMSVIAMCTVFLLGEWVVALLLAAPYRQGAVSIMLLVTLAYSINGFTQVIENRLLSLNAPRKLILSLSVGAVANLIASTAFISWYGVRGAALATCSSFAVQASVTFVLLSIQLKKERSPSQASLDKALRKLNAK